MTEEKSGLSRRTIMKGAAWSVPVVAAAVATPLAAASTGNASLSWTASSTGLLTLHLIDEGGTLDALALVTVPTQFSIENGAGPISGTATIKITVGTPSGINITAGNARGFGVYSYDGVVTPASERSLNQGIIGFPTTTWQGVRPVAVSSNGTLDVPIEFGLAGSNARLVSISGLASFPVTLTVDFGGGNSYTASTAISVPISAGLL